LSACATRAAIWERSTRGMPSTVSEDPGSGARPTASASIRSAAERLPVPAERPP
jgi:hypothetical protein